MVGAVTAMQYPDIKMLPSSLLVDKTGLAMEIVYAEP